MVISVLVKILALSLMGWWLLISYATKEDTIKAIFVFIFSPRKDSRSYIQVTTQKAAD